MKGTYTKHTSLKAGELKSVFEDSGPSVLVTQAVVWVKEHDESSFESIGSRLLALWSTLFFYTVLPLPNSPLIFVLTMGLDLTLRLLFNAMMHCVALCAAPTLCCLL